jgi:hypothetical protein
VPVPDACARLARPPVGDDDLPTLVTRPLVTRPLVTRPFAATPMDLP